MAQIGDTVRYLNAVGGGRITKIEGNMAYVDDDGFETPVLLRECVVVASGANTNAPTPKAQSKQQPTTTTATATPQNDVLSETDTEETPEGEKLNVVLAYEPAEIKHLTTTTFDTYLVNDSNYYLYFTYMTRSDDGGWTTRYAGIVEPNIQVFIDEVTHDDLPKMDRIAIQYIAFKRDKEFGLKAPVAVENRLDTTKFFKLHCFRENIYFDKPVIAIDITKNDIPQRSMVIDSGSIEEAIRKKKAVDKPKKRPVIKKKKTYAQNNGIIEVDLHITELVDTTAGLSNADMLNMQIDEFRKVMDANGKKHGQKIVFIHGKGEGVLRQALMKELTHRYKGHDVQDASFREYGFGATQVTIR